MCLSSVTLVNKSFVVSSNAFRVILPSEFLMYLISDAGSPPSFSSSYITVVVLLSPFPLSRTIFVILYPASGVAVISFLLFSSWLTTSYGESSSPEIFPPFTNVSSFSFVTLFVLLSMCSFTSVVILCSFNL